MCVIVKLNSGKVVAVGPGALDKSGNKIPVAVKEGDTVLLPEYGGTQVKLGEKEYVFFYQLYEWRYYLASFCCFVIWIVESWIDFNCEN